MHRFYADCAAPEAGMEVSLPPSDAHHAQRVLRLTEGAAVEIMAANRRFDGIITLCSPDNVTVRLTEEKPSTEAALRITLFQGLPKSDKMDLIVQKATELGVAQVVPVAMSRSVVVLKGNDGQKKQERWQKIAAEAGKQSGRTTPLEVSVPVTFKEALQLSANCEASCVPYEDERGCTLTGFARSHADLRTLAVWIGPEGGIAPEEIARMQENHMQCVTLGPRILRTETAGLCAVSALMCLYGEF